VRVRAAGGGVLEGVRTAGGGGGGGGSPHGGGNVSRLFVSPVKVMLVEADGFDFRARL